MIAGHNINSLHVPCPPFQAISTEYNADHFTEESHRLELEPLCPAIHSLLDVRENGDINELDVIHFADYATFVGVGKLRRSGFVCM